MSLWEDSPANQCQSQVKEKEQMTTAISGQKCLDSLGRSNPNSLLGRMCKELLTSKTAWYSDRCKTTWKVKVSKSNVFLFQLQASVLGTRGTESGLWATPNTMDHLPPRSKEGTLKLQQGHRKGRTRPANLREQVDPETMRMYPTPRSSGQENPETLIKRKGVKAAAQHNLTAAVQMYPTPTVGCEEGGEQSSRVERTKSGGFILRKKNKPDSTFGAKLSDAMLYLEKKKLFYSPTTNDSKNLTLPKSQKDRHSVVGDMLQMKQNKPGGKLNPTFVEFLMGFPMNWTKTEPTESRLSVTQSSHRLQESSDLQLKKFYPTPRAHEPGRTTKGYGRGLAELMEGKEQKDPKK